MTKIIIFSDTHGHMREIPYLKNPDEYDYLIYLGDGYEEVGQWAENKKLGDKFISVTGNCDYAPHIPRQRFFKIEDINIFITHGDLYSVKTSYNKIFDKAKSIGADIAMFGHTHYADHNFVEGVHLFNPGSILPRGRDFCSVGYLEILNNEIIEFDHLIF